MSLLAASRQFCVALAKHLRAMSVLPQHSDLSQPQPGTVHEVRYYSHPGHRNSEDVEEHVRKTRGKSSNKARHKPLRFNQKLHNRVFTEEELAENRSFRKYGGLPLVPENSNEGDMFGTLRQRGETERSGHPASARFKTVFEDDAQNPLDRYTSGTEGKSAPSRATFAQQSDSASTEKVGRTLQHSSRGRVPSRGWSDEFGTLSEDTLADRIEESLRTGVGSHEERFADDEDEQESMRIRLSASRRRHVPEWYGRRILKLGKRGQVREAIEVLEEWMLKQDRVMPNAFVFTCLLTVLGRAGYTKKAFSLFRKMKSMGIQPKPATYTALFNACANSPWRTDGQTRADNLVRLMKEKEVEPTFITGKAMVKAFAMCGDLRRAFSLVDELSQTYQPDPEMFSFLLMACISDKEAGLRHAIQVWRVMQQLSVRPDLPLYNLLLRCVRDCGVGDLPSFTALLTRQDAAPQLHPGAAQQAPRLSSYPGADPSETVNVQPVERSAAPDSSSSVVGERVSLEVEAVNAGSPEQQAENERGQGRGLAADGQTGVLSRRERPGSRSPSALSLCSSVTIPDVLSPGPRDSRVVSLSDLSTKENRLLLLGGVEGVLSRMARDDARADVITFTQLISVALPTVEAEEHLLATMKSMRVKADIDLVNALIHKRCMRADFAAARAVQEMISEYKLTANQMTYGVLAMTCKTQKEAAQLLEDMEAADMMPNMEILGTLMYASGMKFGYKLWVLRQAQGLDLLPNSKFLHNVENSLALVRRKMVHAEKRDWTDHHLLSLEFQHSVETFTQHYESWLKRTQVQAPRHPWANFRAPSTDSSDVA